VIAIRDSLGKKLEFQAFQAVAAFQESQGFTANREFQRFSGIPRFKSVCILARFSI